MDLSLSQTEKDLAASVRSFISNEAPTPALVALQRSEHGYQPEWTGKMADAGWLGALVPADCGGVDATCLQAAVIWEELGRAPLPGPYLVSSMLSALLLRAAEPGAPREELLAGIAEGQAIVVPVLGATAAGWDGPLAGAPAEADGKVSGTFPYVPYARAASHLLLPVRRGDGTGLAVLPAKTAGIEARPLPGFLAWNDELSVTGAALENEVLRVPAERLSDAMARAYTLLAMYMVGGCQALLERCVAYSGTRVQFGMPVGRFQRVQDHIVELANALDAARWACYDALWRIDSGRDAVARSHLAQAVASESYITCTNAAHKVHGGIGVDPDYGLTLYTQQARSLRSFLGGPRWHKRQMADALGWTA